MIDYMELEEQNIGEEIQLLKRVMKIILNNKLFIDKRNYCNNTKRSNTKTRLKQINLKTEQ